MEGEGEIDQSGAGDVGAEPSRRDEIAQAFEQAEADVAAPEAPAAQPPARDAAAPAPAPAADRARDPATGRFVDAPAKPAAKPAAAPIAPALAPGAKPPPLAAKAPLDPNAKPLDAPPASRAPATWKPAAREHWAKLPPDVQAEVTRREQEVGRTLQESAQARNALSHVQQVIGPFAQNIAASGRDAITFIGELAKADNTLRHGSISDKATFMAGLIKSYGVDIQALDQALAGQQVTPDPNAQVVERMRAEMQQQLQPVLGLFNQLQGQRQNAMQQINGNAANDVEAFAADPAHEFFEDVRVDMADIMDMFAKRGQQISLQEAYDRAINMHPQVSAIVAQRAEAARASNAAAAAVKARRTAVSLSSAPAPAGAAPGPAGEDRRATIEAAWDSQGS